MLQQVADDFLQYHNIETGRTIQQHGLVLMMYVFQLTLEEPVLNRRTRHWSGDRFLLVLHNRSGIENQSEFRDRLMLKKLSRSQTPPGLIGASDNLDAENGITAERKKVVVNAHLLEPK